MKDGNEKKQAKMTQTREDNKEEQGGREERGDAPWPKWIEK